MRPVVLRALARSDVEATIDYYCREASETIAIAFIDALEKAFQSIRRRPAAASSRYAYVLDLPGLRSKPVGKYPYLIFFVERADAVDVWRVLHTHRDLPKSLTPPGDQ